MTAPGKRTDHADRLMAAVDELLPAPETWTTPTGYPSSLALCVVDAIQSIGVRYGSVEKVVRRYRSLRAAAGGDAGTDDITALRETFDQLGGPVGWAERVGTGHRTSTRPGAPLKAEVIQQAARQLPDWGVTTTADLRGLADDPDRWLAVKDRWTSLPGQRSGISWHYLNMLAGVPGVKPDRMLRRFVARAVGDRSGALGNDDLVQLVRDAAKRLKVSDTALDHAIWRFVSGRQRTAGAKSTEGLTA